MAGRWTSEQDLYLKRWWGRASQKTILKHLPKYGPARTLDAVKVRAVRLGLTDRVPTGYVKLVEVHPQLNSRGRFSAHWMARQKAIRDGVVVRADRLLGQALLVPEWWAEEYTEELARQAMVRKQGRRLWMSGKELSMELGIASNAGGQYIRGSRGPRWWREAIKSVPKYQVRKSFNAWVVSREGVMPLVRRYKSEGRPAGLHFTG